MTTSTETRRLRAQVSRLEEELEALRDLITGTKGVSEPPDDAPNEAVSRRSLLRLAGAGAAGAAASAVLMASPAGASDPNDVVLGADNSTTTRTKITSSSSDVDAAFNATNTSTSTID